MTSAEVQHYLAGLSDDELADRLRVAVADLERAAEEENESEWHEACFAASVLYCQESDRRKRARLQ